MKNCALHLSLILPSANNYMHSACTVTYVQSDLDLHCSITKFSEQKPIQCHFQQLKPVCVIASNLNFMG